MAKVRISCNPKNKRIAAEHGCMGAAKMELNSHLLISISR